MRILILLLGILLAGTVRSQPILFPGDEWDTTTPAEVALNADELQEFAEWIGGRGIITRYGKQVFTWGDPTRSGDVASAAKPIYSFLLLKAYQDGRIPSLDQPVSEWQPALVEPPVPRHDRRISWRQMANQTSCYGLEEEPGSAYAYNDWQMALFLDTLMLEVLGTTHAGMDEDVLHPELTDVIQCQDSPTLLAFGAHNRAGRLAISPRDFARFGFLILQQGRWTQAQVLRPEYVHLMVSSPLPPMLPRADGPAVPMLEGQRSIGSRQIPDSQTHHFGSYSWLWWINGVDTEDNRRWPSAPEEVWAALGHRNGMRGMAVIPEWDMVLSWNDTRLGDMPENPHPLDTGFAILKRALRENGQ